jgi:T-complex protein 1 subunit eta
LSILTVVKTHTQIRLKDPDQYQQIVDAEWNIIYEKLRKIVDSGAKIVLSRLPIGDLATQYFADHDVFCAGRVESDDVERIAKATGAKLQTSLNDLSNDVLGTCATFEERQVLRPTKRSLSRLQFSLVVYTYVFHFALFVIGWR